MSLAYYAELLYLSLTYVFRLIQCLQENISITLNVRTLKIALKIRSDYEKFPARGVRKVAE